MSPKLGTVLNFSGVNPVCPPPPSVPTYLPAALQGGKRPKRVGQRGGCARRKAALFVVREGQDEGGPGHGGCGGGRLGGDGGAVLAGPSGNKNTK